MNRFIREIKVIFYLIFKKSLFWSNMLALSYLLQCVISFVYVYVIDLFFQSIYKNYSSNNSKLMLAFLSYVIIVLLKHIVDGINVFTINSFNRKINSESKYSIMERMDSIKYSNFEDISKLNFINSIKNFKMDDILVFYMSIFFYYIPYSIILMTYLFKIDKILGIFSVFLFIPVFLSKLFQCRYSVNFKNNTENSKRKQDLFLNYFFDINILNEIKEFLAEKYFLNLYKKNREHYLKENRNFQKKILKLEILFKILSGIVFFIICYILIRLTLDRRINIAGLSASIFIISELISSIVNMIVYDSNLLLENYGAFKKYVEFFYDENYFEKIEYAKNNVSKKLIFDKVYFKYPNSNVTLLENINFEINEKEKVALVGRNGSGKSTLFKLMLGLYRPTSGEIFYNYSNDFKKFNNSVAFQDYSKYKVNLKDNIIISDLKNGFIEEKFNDVFELTNLKEYFDDINMELASEFNGKVPSGGMWNNISIARCLYRTASIYFMDEPMANFDSIKEKTFFDKLLKYFEDKTLVFITHNLGIVKKFEKIIVMDSGKIVSIGNHEYLLENCDLYKTLYFSQKEMYI